MCQNHLIALAISMQGRRNYSQRIQHVSKTLAAASLYYEDFWGDIPKLSLTGIGEWKERETFISHYMIAAWQHLNLYTGCIHPMQSGSDSSLNKITK